jgi:hypothetical protein
MYSKVFYSFLIIWCLSISKASAQNAFNSYLTAYDRIEAMLLEIDSLDFKTAVYLTENAYLDNLLNNELFDESILQYSSFCKNIINSGSIVYPEKDREEATAQCAVFMFMTDTIPVMTDMGVAYHTPFEYNFDDYAGQKDWSSMFVSTLMETKKGNCHSLPYLYKMIMNEIGQESYLSLAPNHIYIKAKNKRVGWYNVELTCGDFPTDAWLMASGYIHTDAVRNGIYMEALSEKQSVALCLVDLAQGYQAKFGIDDGSFILKCCDTALQHFPNYINAMLLKAETLTALHKKAASDSEDSKNLLVPMNQIYTQIHDSGYRKMPKGMYLNWLNTLGTQDVNHRAKSLLLKEDM